MNCRILPYLIRFVVHHAKCGPWTPSCNVEIPVTVSQITKLHAYFKCTSCSLSLGFTVHDPLFVPEALHFFNGIASIPNLYPSGKKKDQDENDYKDNENHKCLHEILLAKHALNI